MEKIVFATGNQGKVEEMRPLFEDKGFSLEQVNVDIREIDALDVENVAERKARDSFREIEGCEPVIVEDTGFFVESLGGFPGATASFFDETVGAEKLLKLFEPGDDRSAYFKTAIAFFDGERINVETGRIEGQVPREIRGKADPHLPYDSLFVPGGSDMSFAEDMELKQKASHRERATEKLIRWLSRDSR